MRKLLNIVVMMVGMAVVAAASVSATPAEDFDKANAFYRDKEYDKAIELYKGIAEQGIESGALYFNLGNAYFKNGDLGHAILYYLKAKRLAPGDDDIVNNLEFAQQFTSIQMEGVQLNPINSFFESIVAPYRLSSLAWIASAFFILFMIALIVRYGLGFRTSMVRAGIVVTLVLLVSSAFITTFKYRHDYLTQRAVLVADETPVRSGPSEEMDVELEGAPGLVVEILSESGDYYNVLFENKRRGWIKKDLVAEI